jgi:hypothetical protein
METLEEEQREKRTEKIFGAIMIENFPKLKLYKKSWT